MRFILIVNVINKNVYLTNMDNKTETEKQNSTNKNSHESYYKKWQPLIDRKVVH